jgi:hypothetical protein
MLDPRIVANSVKRFLDADKPRAGDTPLGVGEVPAAARALRPDRVIAVEGRVGRIRQWVPPEGGRATGALV